MRHCSFYYFCLFNVLILLLDLPKAFGNGFQQHVNFYLLPQQCGGTRVLKNGAGNRIVGGNEAPRGAYPWMALLIFRNPGTGATFPSCGGSLINGRYVISAAHCFYKGNDFDRIVLGVHNFQEECSISGYPCPVHVGAEQIINHPQNHGDRHPFYNDITLIRLNRDVLLDQHPHISPICLPIDIWQFNQVIAAGWGWNHFHANQMSPALREVVINSNGLCYQCNDLRNLNCWNKNEMQVCITSGSDRDSCYGDSGGPLMVIDSWNRYVLVGSTSHKNSYCGDPNQPTMYVRIRSYIKWILDNMRP